MFRPILVGLFGLVFCVGLAFEGAAQQAPSPGAQPLGGRGRGPGPPTPPPLSFKETWQITGPPHAIAPCEVVVTNPNLELKMYGPSATAADPNKRIWIIGSSRSRQHLDRHVYDALCRNSARQEQLCGPDRHGESPPDYAGVRFPSGPASHQAKWMERYWLAITRMHPRQSFWRANSTLPACAG